MTEKEVLDKLEELEKKEDRGSLVDGGNPLARKCPKDGCEGVAIAQNFDQKVVSCPDCDEAICFECHDTHHPGITCDQNLENRFRGEF